MEFETSGFFMTSKNMFDSAISTETAEQSTPTEIQQSTPTKILFHSHMNDLSAAFRRGEWIENKLFPVDHVAALNYKQRTEAEPENAEYWVEIEKAVALFRAVEKSKVSIAAIAHNSRGADDYELGDQAWLSLTHRQKSRHARRAHEAIALAAGLVGSKSGNKNCSPAAKARRGEQLKAQDEWLKTQSAFNSKTGKAFRLASAAEKRKNRLSEMFAMMKGIEKLIQSDSLQWSACVVTAPAHMHPNPTMGRSSWDGTLPHEVATWLSEGWALIRARLAKLNITLSGGWFRESHQDSTPHVNFFLVFNTGDYREVARAFKEVFGHSKKAVKMMLGADPHAVAALEKKGKKPASFASYAMKYFMKGLSGWGNDGAADREETTASTFAYRRHGFFGLPALSTWRELRRLKTCPKDSKLLAATWRAVHRGDAAEWIMRSGGLACKRNERPIQPLRVAVEGCKQKQVIGVIEIGDGLAGGAYVKTRTPKAWEIKAIKDLPNNIKSKLPKVAVVNKNGSQNHLVTVKVNYPREAEGTTKKPELKLKLHEKEAQNWLNDDIYEYVAAIKHQHTPAERQLTADQRKIAHIYAQIH
jgi:hypothetical protein